MSFNTIGANAHKGVSAPTLSVVMPNYNHGAILSRAVEAFLRQGVSIEIIVVDDASTDNSVDVIEALCATHEQIRLIRRAENAGPSAAINQGLAVARGEYVVFSAADDLVDQTFAERAIGILKKYPQAGFSFLDPSILDGDGEVQPSISLALASEPVYFTPHQVERLFARNSFTISSNTVIYRREAISSIGGFRTDLLWHCDWMANLVLAFRHGACYLPEPLAHFYIDPDGYGSKGVRSKSDQKRLVFACLHAFKADYPDVAPAIRRAAILPEMRLRTLVWLLGDRDGRRYLTFPLVLRLVGREVWNFMRPLTPLGVRRIMRRLVAKIAVTRKFGWS